MPKNICVDLNIFIDIVLQRADYQASRDIVSHGEQGVVKLFVSTHEVTTFDYVLKRNKVQLAERNYLIAWLLRICTVVATGEKALTEALHSVLTDYEDAVVEQAALAAKCDYIVTRNVKDFAGSAVPAVTPEAYLNIH